MYEKTILLMGEQMSAIIKKKRVRKSFIKIENKIKVKDTTPEQLSCLLLTSNYSILSEYMSTRGTHVGPTFYVTG